MAEEPVERKSARSRRANVKKYREDMYEYDMPEKDGKGDSNQFQQELKSEDDHHADDDSFSYNGPKPKKTLEAKKAKIKEKQTKLVLKKGVKNENE